jgi:hypothetical protein
MPSTTSLVINLTRDYPQLLFKPGNDFYWSPNEKTVYYVDGSNDVAAFLHELAHGLLEHSDYPRDITLIELERDAWTQAIDVLAPKYDMVIDSATAETALDSYRDWLHARSTCPNCHATGIQTKTDTYRCVACRVSWRVNEARICALRRYRLHK